MASMKSPSAQAAKNTVVNNQQIYKCINCLNGWLEKSDYSGHDPFDGLNAKLLRPLTFENKYLRMALQQGVRRFLINLRPVLGIEKSRSTKGMAFLAKGFLRLYQATGNTVWRDKTHMALKWLIENHSHGYTGACWGNHFDYQSRSAYVKKGTPSVVWTSLIGHAFLDAYDHLSQERFLQIAVSACEHIQRDLGAYSEGGTLCINYFPTSGHQVHNANTLGASLLARTYFHTRNEAFRELAERAMQYTAKYQRPDGSWYYGQEANLHWVDNFHTAYVLDCFKYYIQYTGDTQFEGKLMDGYRYWKKNFFLADGTPRYYNHKTLPIDIQCCSQAIDTLIFFRDRDADSLPLAIRVAQWTIRHMQDRSGYFYYRRYSPWFVNKTPTLHWGQATMLCALAGLYRLLSNGADAIHK
jgi:hypothetical protein